MRTVQEIGARASGKTVGRQRSTWIWWDNPGALPAIPTVRWSLLVRGTLTPTLSVAETQIARVPLSSDGQDSNHC